MSANKIQIAIKQIKSTRLNLGEVISDSVQWKTITSMGKLVFATLAAVALMLKHQKI